jgi:formate hydrogenlyase transcriptional activator
MPAMRRSISTTGAASPADQQEVVSQEASVAQAREGVSEISPPHYTWESEERLRFETLLIEISTSFINLPADQIDGEIINAQRRVCNLLDFDRSVLWQVSEREQGAALLTHFHQSPGDPSIPERPDMVDLFPWSAQKVLSGEILAISKLADLPPEAARDLESFRQYGTKSTLVFPLSTGGGKVLGLLTFAMMREERSWPEMAVKRFQLVAQVFANALARKHADEALRQSYDEIQQLKDRIQAESDYLKAEIRQTQAHGEVIGQSAAIKKVLHQVEQVAPTDATVLICGETGTGKELIAQAIHRLGPRRSRVMVKVNCAALPSGLVESELFGREKGAFTGALSRQIGRFEVADGSTIFLDEVGELSLDVQSKLLQVLQEGQFERLGSPKTIKVNVRVIAATNRDLAEDRRKGRFREDLYYRLSVFPIRVPPLRERAEDIPLLVWAFLEEFCSRMGKKITQVPRKAMEALQRHPWPGNVRELRNVIEHGAIVTTGITLRVPMLDDAATPAAAPQSLADAEYAHIVQALERTGWRVKGPKGAAAMLGLKPSTLYSRMRKLGIPHRRQKETGSA